MPSVYPYARVNLRAGSSSAGNSFSLLTEMQERRLFAIESLHIERVLSIPEEVVSMYVLTATGYTGDLPAWALNMIENTESWLTYGQSVWSLAEIREIHATITRQQQPNPPNPGQWKNHNNHVITRDGTVQHFADMSSVQAEMDWFMGTLRRARINQRNVVLRAAWLHNAFVAIHPFVDGNGRTARIITSLELMSHGYLPLLVTRTNYAAYIAALEASDKGDRVTPFYHFLLDNVARPMPIEKDNDDE